MLRRLILNYNVVSDPHVKVVGQPEAVQMAKELILEILDTKVRYLTCEFLV